MPRVLGISEGEGTAPGPSVDTDKAEKRTPGFAGNTGVRDGETTTKCSKIHWTQSKPRTKSQGKEAVTGTLRRRIEMTPALQGSKVAKDGMEEKAKMRGVLYINEVPEDEEDEVQEGDDKEDGEGGEGDGGEEEEPEGSVDVDEEDD
ncbi:hypothetical protein B0H10DRAFT_1950865 [Mycena sp. CBHHK59/15]|nr:hypothetical protein B0H10DRAFT_1950865 [Mycena sp. CBHHK59/15]